MVDEKTRRLLFTSILILFLIQTVPFSNAQTKTDSEISCSPNPEETSPKWLGKAWTKLTISIHPQPKAEVNVVISLYDTSDNFVSQAIEKIPSGGMKTVDYGVGLQDGAWEVKVKWNGDSELNGRERSCSIIVKLNGWQKALSWGIGWLNVFNITTISLTGGGIAYLLKTLNYGGLQNQINKRYLKAGITSGVLVIYWIIYGAYLSQI